MRSHVGHTHCTRVTPPMRCEAKVRHTRPRGHSQSYHTIELLIGHTFGRTCILAAAASNGLGLLGAIGGRRCPAADNGRACCERGPAAGAGEADPCRGASGGCRAGCAAAGEWRGRGDPGRGDPGRGDPGRGGARWGDGDSPIGD